jgi:hypothetical protein
MRVRCAGAAVFSVLVLVPSTSAQTSEMPTELWSEYPLVQKVERSESSTIGPLLPPVPADPEAAPAPDDSTRWSLWLVLLAFGSIAVLFAVRTGVPVAASGLRVVGGGARQLRGRVSRPTRPRKPRPTQLREHPSHPRAPASRTRTQYAPLPPVSVAEPDVEREPRRYVVRRTGFLRSRFVVVADEPGGKVSHVARSRSFPRVGDVARREESADDAWRDLVNELRAGGWEPSAQLSDFWVPLRRVDDGPSSILPTIEAYTRASEPRDEA